MKKFFFLALLLMFAASVWAQPQTTTPTVSANTATKVPATSPASEAAPTTVFGAITGRVVSEDGPLPFVSITVLPVSNANTNRGPGNNSFRNVMTDREGNFKVDGLRASAWQVIPSAQGYVVESTNDEANQSFFRIGEAATIRMVKGGVITGRVLNSVGEPMIAVPVSVQYVRDAQGAPAMGGSTGGVFQTDDRGVYRIYGLQPGSYVVCAGRTGGAGGGPGGGGPGGRFSPYDGDVPTYFPSATRDTAVEVAVSSGGETAGIDIQYRGDKGRAISGKITGATSDSNTRGFGPGGGPGGISVTLAHAATGAVFNRTFVMSRNGTNSYALYGVPDGEYEVTAERNSPGNNDAASVPRRVVVSGRDVTGIDLTLVPLASIQARLQLENEIKDSKCEVKRKPAFTEQLFFLQPEETSASPQRRNLRRAIFDNHLGSPDHAGEMSFRNLTVGRYHLLSKLLDDNWYIRSITMPGPTAKATAKAPTKTTVVDVARNGLYLKSGDKLTGVTVKVSEGAAAINGKVKAEENNPLPPMLRVYLVPVEKERADDVLRYSETGISADGSFSFGHLAPGKYWLTTRIEIDDAQKKLRDNAERAKLRREAEAANVVVELQACQRLTNYEVRLKK